MELYYIQNRSSIVGNCMLWWGRKGHGYTCDLANAETFDRERAEAAIAGRGCFRIWPKEYIDAVASVHVDCQEADFAASTKPPQCSAHTMVERMLGKEDQPSPWAVTPKTQAQLGLRRLTTTPCPACFGEGHRNPHEQACPVCKGIRMIPVYAGMTEAEEHMLDGEEGRAFTGFEVAT